MRLIQLDPTLGWYDKPHYRHGKIRKCDCGLTNGYFIQAKAYHSEDVWECLACGLILSYYNTDEPVEVTSIKMNNRFPYHSYKHKLKIKHLWK